MLTLLANFRVSEYLMGDFDSNISLASSISSKTKVWFFLSDFINNAPLC